VRRKENVSIRQSLEEIPMTYAPLTPHSSLLTQRLKPLVVIVGPTAVGKSQVGVLVAKALGTEVLTADSRQVYRGMDIGTDKPGPEERQGVPHRLIDLVEPDQPFNVGVYRRQALAEIERLHRTGRIPLVVGGTGLYVRALIRGLWAGPFARDWWGKRARRTRAISTKHWRAWTPNRPTGCIRMIT